MPAGACPREGGDGHERMSRSSATTSTSCPRLSRASRYFLRLSKTWKAGLQAPRRACPFRPAKTGEGLCILYAPGHGGEKPFEN